MGVQGESAVSTGETAAGRFLWSRLADVTVGEHPGVPLELERKRGRMGPKQRQHCLFGFFGAGGAEKVILVSRWEWPPQGSLFEVQQALVLVREMAGRMQQMMEQQGGRAALPQGFGGKMVPADDDGRPPLD